MITDRGAKPVVVGIDGSEGAVQAAVWGAAEALQHDVALTLLYVIDHSRAVTGSVLRAEHLVANAALQSANAAIEATQRPIKVESEVVQGDPGSVLIEQSWASALLCVGAPKARPHGPFDSLATNLAAHARCTVAVVPATHAPLGVRSGWVVTLVEPAAIDYDALQQAMEEAELRGIPLLVVMTTPANAMIDELLISWTQRYPKMELRLEHTEHLLSYVAQHERSIRSVVLSADRRRDISQMIDLVRSKAAAYNSFSVVIVRDQHL